VAYLLYGAKGTGAMAVEAALDEIGAAWEVVNLDRTAGEHLAAPYTGINPRQQVPALVVDGTLVLTEGPAILTWLGDRHATAALAPAPGSPDRARHDRWLAFL
jgi:GST-like protein